MPVYPDNGTNNQTLSPIVPTCLYPGDEKYLFGTAPATPGVIQAPNDTNVVPEAVALNEASIAVSLVPKSYGGPAGAMIQITTANDPGAAVFQIQDAAKDADGAYITPGGTTYTISVWTHNGAYWTAWAEFQPEGGRFIRLLCSANPNAVTFTAKISYQ